MGGGISAVDNLQNITHCCNLTIFCPVSDYEYRFLHCFIKKSLHKPLFLFICGATK